MKKEKYISPAIVIMNITSGSLLIVSNESTTTISYSQSSVTEQDASGAASRSSSWGDDE